MFHNEPGIGDSDPDEEDSTYAGTDDSGLE